MALFGWVTHAPSAWLNLRDGAGEGEREREKEREVEKTPPVMFVSLYNPSTSSIYSKTTVNPLEN